MLLRQMKYFTAVVMRTDEAARLASCRRAAICTPPFNQAGELSCRPLPIFTVRFAPTHRASSLTAVSTTAVFYRALCCLRKRIALRRLSRYTTYVVEAFPPLIINRFSHNTNSTRIWRTLACKFPRYSVYWNRSGRSAIYPAPAKESKRPCVDGIYPVRNESKQNTKNWMPDGCAYTIGS